MRAMKRILILKRSSFGDIVHTLPVIPHLRAKYPDSEISWLTEPGNGRLLRAVQGVDSVLEIGFRSMLRSGRFKEYLNRLRFLLNTRFDALIDFQGTAKSWLLIRLTKADRKIGFNRADVREPIIAGSYSEHLPPLPAGLHVIRQYLRLLRQVEIETDQITFPEIDISADDREKIERWFTLRRIDSSGLVVAVNSFTAWPTKSWPLDHAIALCRMIRRELNACPIMLAGPTEEDAAREAVNKSEGAAVLAPKADQLQLAALLQRVDLYVGGDTGPTQLATALGVPTVALFGPTDPKRNGPFDERDIVLRHELNCKNCSRKKCSLGEKPECMSRITPDSVLTAIRSRLESDR